MHRHDKKPFKMRDKRNLLVAAIIFTALFHEVTAAGGKALDMARDAVDNLYSECRDQALQKFIYSGLLRQELNNSKAFQTAWSSHNPCSKLMPGKLQEHTAALLAYTYGDRDFLQTFDNAVETLGRNEGSYENLFHFKSFHFLLMDSMTLQPPNNCTTLYTKPEEIYTARKGSKVRFGLFTTAYSSLTTLNYLDMAADVIFKITSCFFANLGENICLHGDAVLLSPAEVFTVEDVKTLTDEDDMEYTEIILKHSGVVGSNGCKEFSLLSRSAADFSTRWPVLAIVPLHFFSFNY